MTKKPPSRNIKKEVWRRKKKITEKMTGREKKRKRADLKTESHLEQTHKEERRKKKFWTKTNLKSHPF